MPKVTLSMPDDTWVRAMALAEAVSERRGTPVSMPELCVQMIESFVRDLELPAPAPGAPEGGEEG